MRDVVFQFTEFGSIQDLTLGLQWSAADFASQVRKRAAALVQAGIEPHSIVMIAHSGSAHFFADLFAVWECGCTAACIDPALTQNEIGTLLDFVQPTAVVVSEAQIDASIGAQVFNLSQSFSSVERTVAMPAGDPNRPALILFTSGTTGSPKGVVLTFRAVLARIALNQAAMGGIGKMRTLVTLPTSFGHGLIGNALTPLLSGGDLVLHPLGLPMAQNLGGIIDEYGIGFLSSVPSFWRMALKFSNAPATDALARIHVGSAPLSARLWTEIAEWSRAEVINCYGITELANWVCGASSKVDGIGDGLVGKPWGAAVAIRNSTGVVHKVGEGELLVQSPSVMSGYLHRPDLTAAAFVDGWYCTGDLGSISNDRSIRLAGRLKDEINRAGHKIQPAEIDALIEGHPAVAEVCVFGMNDVASGEIVAAAVRLLPGQHVSIEALRQWCSTRVHREAVPERWFVIDKIQKNDRGKVDRAAVRKSLCGGLQ